MSQSAQVATGAISLSVIDGTPTTTSPDVAQHFGKDHADVLKRIRALAADIGYRPGYFAETVIERSNPSGGDNIKSPAYRLTRDGFTLLAMGFTGSRALAFKLAYIDAFNRLEAELSGRAAPKLSGRRWMVSFANGREVAQPIPTDAVCVTLAELPALLADPGFLVTPAELEAIGRACVARLAIKAAAGRPAIAGGAV